MKRLLVFISLLALLLPSGINAAQRPDGRRTLYFAQGLTGEDPVVDLDELDITATGNPNQYDLMGGDTAIVMLKDHATYGTRKIFYVFDSSGTNATSLLQYVRPEDFSVEGVWKKVESVTTSTSDPGVNDDFPDYHEGDIWVNTSNEKVWVCVDNSVGAANWDQINTTGASDNIGAGNSKVEVIDTGAGEVQITIDGTVSHKLGYYFHELINGGGIKLISTADGSKYILQVYDTNGSAWRDALTFENGNSSQSSPTDWPRVHLGSNVAFTGWLLDEDDFATDSATLPPSQQSVGAYVLAYLRSGWTISLGDLSDSESAIITQLTFKAGETIVKNNPVYLKYDAGQEVGAVYQYDADAVDADSYFMIGTANNAGDVTDDIVVFLGLAKLVRRDEFEFATATWGKPLWATATAGGIASTAPAVSGDHVNRVGTAINADYLLYRFSIDDTKVP